MECEELRKRHKSGLAESLALLEIQLCAEEIVAKACIKALADVLLRLSQEEQDGSIREGLQDLSVRHGAMSMRTWNEQLG